MNLPKQLALASARSAAKAACVAMLATSLLPAQSNSKDFTPAKIELDLFAGGQLFHKRPDPLATKLLNSTEFGLHLTENLWNYWSLEQSFSGSTLADLTLLPFPGAPNASRIDLEQRVWKLNVNPVYHLTPRGSRVRPFLTIGFTEAIYSATSDGKDYATALKPVAAAGYKTSFKPGLNYGGGFKVRFTDLIGLRMDVRGLWTGAPTWGLPGSNVPAGTLYIPDKGSMHGMEATAGIVFNFGGGKADRTPKPKPVQTAKVEPAPTPAPKPDVQPAAARVFELSPIQANPSSGYAGDSFTFSTSLNDSAHASGIIYSWTVDGVAQPGANGPEFRTSNLGPGTHEITVTAKDPATGATATRTYSITIMAVPPLTITDSTDKNQLKFGESARLSAQGSETAYSGPLTYSWNASVGSVQGSGPNVTFDSSTMPFDAANQFKPESRTVTITPTVRDQRGRTATGSPLQIVVSKDPKAMRLDDLVFGKGSARVNNCAKRILIDELQALMNNNPDVEVLLIGHTDTAETAKSLDHQRVYNAAAVMTAGTGVCAKCDLSRIKVAYAGTDQSSEFRSGFCGTSTRQKSDERKSDEIAADDAAAKNRRVEIWIVPKGVAMPAGAKDPQPAPVKIIKAKGCPK